MAQVAKAFDVFVTGSRGLETAFGAAVKAACKLPGEKLREEIDALVAKRQKELDSRGKSWAYIVAGYALFLMRQAEKGDMPVWEGKNLREWAAFNKNPAPSEKKANPKGPLARFEGTDKQLVAHVLAYYEGNPKGLAAFRKALNA